jgi:hypothetical protein
MPLLWRRVWAATLGLFALLAVSALVAASQKQVSHPPLWDFKVFWTIGHVAVIGHNIYDPASYLPFRDLVNPGHDHEFDTIALGIGMPYPPPAILLFYALGFVPGISTAMTLWYVALFVTLAVATLLLFRAYFLPYKIAGLIAATIFVVALPATAATIELGQLNFIALCFLVLFWNERNPWRAGLWLAPVLILRPFVVLFAVYLVARRRWNTLLATLATLVALFVLSLPFVGWQGLVSYAHRNPSQRYPQVYFGGTDSLYKILSRFDRDPVGYFSLAAHPWFVVIACVLVAASVAVCLRGGPAQRDACLGTLLALGLFLYPNTGSHYAVLLLPALCVLWRDRKRLGIGTLGATGILTFEYVALGFGAATGIVFGLDAFLFAALALRRPAPSRGLRVAPSVG